MEDNKENLIGLFRFCVSVKFYSRTEMPTSVAIEAKLQRMKYRMGKIVSSLVLLCKTNSHALCAIKKWNMIKENKKIIQGYKMSIQ